MKEKGFRNQGSFETGKKRPHRNIIGNRKKFERVWAWKTSVTQTAMKNPRSALAAAIRKTETKKVGQMTEAKSLTKNAIKMGRKEFTIPKNNAPESFATISRAKGKGATSNLSNARVLFSKVIVTASIELLPKSTAKETTPGRSSLISPKLRPALIKKRIVQARGKRSPQLRFGGFR